MEEALEEAQALEEALELLVRRLYPGLLRLDWLHLKKMLRLKMLRLKMLRLKALELE